MTTNLSLWFKDILNASIVLAFLSLALKCLGVV